MNRKPNHQPLTSGRFAKLCRTTKETLYFYEQEQLLKPRYIGLNGYRYYGAEQFFDFDLISVLKESGSSLKDIRRYQQQLSLQSLDAMLSQKGAELTARIVRLMHQQQMLFQMQSLVVYCQGLTFNQVAIKTFNEEHFESWPCTLPIFSDYSELSASMAEFINHFLAKEQPLGFPMGRCFPVDALQNESTYSTKLFAKSQCGVPGECTFHRGNYVTIAVQGGKEEHLQALTELNAFVQDDHLALDKEIFAFDLLSWVQLRGKDQLATEYRIRLQD